MKKIATVMIAVLLVLSMAIGLVACTNNDTEVQSVIKEAAKMSWDELLAKAKEEIGDNELSIYGTTSRVNEQSFTEKTGIKVKVSQPNDSQIFEKLREEVGNNLYGADVILTTDSFNIVNNAMANGWVENYVPGPYADKIAQGDQNPLVCFYYNRAFVYNNGKGEKTNYLKNVWQLTEAEYAGCEVKSPMDEKCTMNFLITLTSPEWQTKLKEAYKKYYNKEWAASDKYDNVSLEWIDKFIANCSFVGKDGTIASNVEKGQAGSIGFYTLSKFRSAADKTTLTVAANEGIEGFGAMLFPMYIMLTSNAKYPYAACLYVNYLLGTEGYHKVFGEEMGAYSSNTSIPLTANAIADGDKELSYWQQRSVIEDAQYVASVYATYYTKFAQWCAAKG